MDGNKKSLGDLSTNFWKWEFRCPCKKCRRKKVQVSQLLIFKLEMLRVALGDKPIIINSGNRCPEENEKVNGYPNSAHIPKPDGEAADIKIKGVKPIDIGLAAEKIGGLRIGIAKTYVHLDVRPPSPSKYWIYLNKIIYSGSIENNDLLKFYQIIKEGK
jgi:uncharacterized protein YcbK (DUF882 family)